MLVRCEAQSSKNPDWTPVRVVTIESERYLSVPTEIVRVDWGKAYAGAAWGIKPARLTQQAPACLEVELLESEADAVWCRAMSADGPARLHLGQNLVSFQTKLAKF